MAGTEKRVPGQDNADYGHRHDPNSDFVGTESLSGGGDASFVYRALRRFLAWCDRWRDRQEPADR